MSMVILNKLLKINSSFAKLFPIACKNINLFATFKFLVRTFNCRNGCHCIERHIQSIYISIRRKTESEKTTLPVCLRL